MRYPLAGSLFLAVACRATPIDPLPTLDELRAAPTSLVVAGRQVSIEVSLWRDFMPAAPPDGQPLAVVIRLPKEAVSLEVTNSWVVLESQVWAAAPTVVDAYERRWAARDGPKWGPGVDVDVVMRVRDSGGSAYLVRTPKVPINRTD